MHQPLDVAKPGERRRVVAQAPFQAGQDAIADHQADIPATAGFLDSLLDPFARFVRLQRQAAQVAAVQQEPPAHRVAALRRQVLEAFRPWRTSSSARATSPRAWRTRARS